MSVCLFFALFIIRIMLCLGHRLSFCFPCSLCKNGFVFFLGPVFEHFLYRSHRVCIFFVCFLLAEEITVRNPEDISEVGLCVDGGMGGRFSEPEALTVVQRGATLVFIEMLSSTEALLAVIFLNHAAVF